jgi:Rrf2 family protein
MPGFFKISEAANLAFYIMLLAAAHSGDTVRAKTYAEKLKASEAHISKVLQQLRRGNFLSSQRGPTGGFRMTRDADKIRLIEIYEAMEGRVEINGCLLNEQVCKKNGVDCVFHELTTDLNLSVLRFMSDTTLADLVIRYNSCYSV